jgi:hypothetical protein
MFSVDLFDEQLGRDCALFATEYETEFRNPVALRVRRPNAHKYSKV